MYLGRGSLLTIKQTRTKKKSPCLIKTENIKNKGRILRAAKEKDQGIYKGRSIRNKLNFSMETWTIRPGISALRTYISKASRNQRLQSPRRVKT